MRINEILYEQFKSVFTPPLGHLKVSNLADFFITADRKTQTVIIGYTKIKEDSVIRAADEMHLNSATSPDGFPGIFLKACKQV